MFKKWYQEKTMEEIKEAGKVMPETNSSTPATPVYQVGLTTDGSITLRVGDEYSHSTLTMNTSAVIRLIRILEAAVEDEIE